MCVCFCLCVCMTMQLDKSVQSFGHLPDYIENKSPGYQQRKHLLLLRPSKEKCSFSIKASSSGNKKEKKNLCKTSPGKVGRCLRRFLFCFFLFHFPDFIPIPLLCLFCFCWGVRITSNTSDSIPQPSSPSHFHPLLPNTTLCIWIHHNAGFSVWQEPVDILLGRFPRISQQPRWKEADQTSTGGAGLQSDWVFRRQVSAVAKDNVIYRP